MIAFLGLALDAANDPVQNINGQSDPYYVASDGTPNSVRAAIKNFLGGRLYQMYALFEDRDIAASVLNGGTALPGMGQGNGGYEAEGMEYGVSLGYVLQMLYAYNKAGMLDVFDYPQASLAWSSQWNNSLQVVANQTDNQQTGANAGVIGGNASYWQPINGYGDMTNFNAFKTVWEWPAEGLYFANTGSTEKQFAQWWDYNVPQGGAGGFYARGSTGNSYWLNPILDYAMFAPTDGAGTSALTAIPDNRSSLYPTRYNARGTQQGLRKDRERISNRFYIKEIVGKYVDILEHLYCCRIP